MSTTLFERAVKLTIAPPMPTGFQAKTQNALVVTDLRVKFQITKTLRKEPNTSRVEVYNLNATSRGQLQGKGARVWMEAGYKGSTGVIFVGDVRFIEHRHSSEHGGEQADWITKLELADGERAYKHARVNESFKAGTSEFDILKKVAQKSGWDLGNVQQFLGDLQAQEVNGFCAFGQPWTALEAILKPRGLTWSVQNNAIQILPQKGYVTAVVTQLDEDHGLIGSPCWGSPPTKKKGRVLHVKALLQHQFAPGGRIYLKSSTHTGNVAIQKVEFEGDTHGKDWIAKMEATPV